MKILSIVVLCFTWANMVFSELVISDSPGSEVKLRIVDTQLMVDSRGCVYGSITIMDAEAIIVKKGETIKLELQNASIQGISIKCGKITSNTVINAKRYPVEISYSAIVFYQGEGMPAIELFKRLEAEGAPANKDVIQLKRDQKEKEKESSR